MIGVRSIVHSTRARVQVSPARMPMLIGYAIGALLGAVFLEILHSV